MGVFDNIFDGMLTGLKLIGRALTRGISNVFRVADKLAIELAKLTNLLFAWLVSIVPVLIVAALISYGVCWVLNPGFAFIIGGILLLAIIVDRRL